MSDAAKEPDFEDALKQLEQIVQKLESGEVPLDQSIVLFEEGNRLRSLCQARLDAARLKIESIAKGENGQALTTKPFAQE